MVNFKPKSTKMYKRMGALNTTIEGLRCALEMLNNDNLSDAVRVTNENIAKHRILEAREDLELIEKMIDNLGVKDVVGTGGN